MRLAWWPIVVSLSLAAAAQAPAPPLVLDEAPAGPEEWGYRPVDGAVSRVTPPAFSWRPVRGIAHWELVVGRDPTFERVAYRADGIRWSVHCPTVTLAAGAYAWRYRGIDRQGRTTAWSRTREFRVASGVRELPLPDRQELLGRIPTSHPRLFLRPEALPELRGLAKGKLSEPFARLVQTCDRLVAKPPPTAEPPKYPPGTTRLSEEWRSIWWGNRTYTIRALEGAATLAFTGLIGDREEYRRLATRILLDCARWDPKGATGYRYNDEAGMPYAYHFSRAYTFLHDRLTEEQREQCRRVMAVRGREMYRHLCPRHLWRPFASHSNRAWHFLGEVGIAFFDEIPEAAD